MTNTSLAQPTTLEAIEQELERLRAARPQLSSRISRAEDLLVTHLSCRRQRLIKVRVNAAKRCFLVSGTTTAGAVYVVSPDDWSCSCPDAHRHGRGCKHALACYVLGRVS